MTISAREAAKARQLLREFRKERQNDRAPRIDHKPAKTPRERDGDYLAWLHEDVPCIACLILGPGPEKHCHIEAAHQKAQDAERGWHKLMGRKVHDRQCVALCAWHHRIAPNCCDPAQGKFWALLGVDVIAFCDDLYRAFANGDQGQFVVWDHAHRASAPPSRTPPERTGQVPGGHSE